MIVLVHNILVAKQKKPRCQRISPLYRTYFAHTHTHTYIIWWWSCKSTWYCQDSLHFGILKFCFIRWVLIDFIISARFDLWVKLLCIFKCRTWGRTGNDDDDGGSGGCNDVNIFLLFIQVMLLAPRQMCLMLFEVVLIPDEAFCVHAHARLLFCKNFVLATHFKVGHFPNIKVEKHSFSTDVSTFDACVGSKLSESSRRPFCWLPSLTFDMETSRLKNSNKKR